MFNTKYATCLVLGLATLVSLTLDSLAGTPPAQPATGTAPTTQVSAPDAPVTQSSAGDAAADLTGLSLEDLLNVEVTSVSKTKQRIADATASVTVISQDDMQRSGSNEIPEMLRMSPGLFVQRGNQFTGWSIASRGSGALFSDQLLVLQDGRSLYTPLFSGVYWNTVDYPIADLDRIEVIRGPGATLWGANAVNGVINITSKSARETQGFLVDSRVGSDSDDLTARYGAQIDDETYFRVYGKGRSYSSADVAINPVGEYSDWQDSRSGFRIDRYVSAQDTLTLQGDGFYQAAADKLVTGHIVPNYTHDYRSGANLLGRWTHVDSDNSDMSLQAYYDNISLQDGFATYVGNTFDVDFQHRFQLLAGNELMYGFGARLIDETVGTHSLSQPVVNPSARDLYLLSAFVQDTVTLVPDRLQLIAGSKFEVATFNGFDCQPSARLLWTPSSTVSLWGAVSRAVRTPSLLEWDDAVRIVVPTTPGHFAQLNKTSDHPADEELLSYEIGYRQQLTKSLSYDVSVFANNYDNLIGLESTGTTHDPNANPPTLINSTYTNGQKAQTYGTEISANLQVTDRWRLTGAYSLLVANVEDTKPKMTPTASAVEQSAPRNEAQLHSYYDVTRNLQFNSALYYVERIGNGNVLGSTGAAPGSYIRADFNISWNPKPGLRLTVGVENAFDPHHLESSFNAKASADVDRAVYGQIAWEF